MTTPGELVVFYPSPRSPRPTRPRSSGDRATASGAVCAGSNPAGGTLCKVPKDPVTSGNAESGVFAYVQASAARSGCMSESVDEAWTGSWSIAAGEPWRLRALVGECGPPPGGRQRVRVPSTGNGKCTRSNQLKGESREHQQSDKTPI